jgi:hypothetical protein
VGLDLRCGGGTSDASSWPFARTQKVTAPPT